MKQVPDRRKLRKSAFPVKSWSTVVSMLPCALLTVLFAVFAVKELYRLRWWGFLLYASATVQAAVITHLYGKGIKLHLVAMGISPTPPVNSDTLPADEILVRSSEEPPVAQSEVLLRAAQGKSRSDLDSMEELLRVSQE